MKRRTGSSPISFLPPSFWFRQSCPRITTHRPGFTLVELLVVTGIIGILAAVALGKFGAVKERAAVAAMQHELKRMAIAEEEYYVKNGTYAGGTVNATDSIAGVDFQLGDDIKHVLVAAFADTAFSILTAHNKTAITCVLDTRRGPGFETGKVVCTE